MFSSENLIWVKNVKDNIGSGWAYDNVKCGKTFRLNWPTSKKRSAETAKVDDIILLFQRPTMLAGKRNYTLFLTHLVTPISKEVTVDDEHPQHKWCREVKLIAVANPISSIPNPGYYNFFKPNRGLTNPIINVTNNKGLSEIETQEDIWRLFHDYFCLDIQNEIFHAQNPEGIFGELEGDIIIREHIKQELARRNSRIVQEAKSHALRNGNGSIKCECCDFDFYESYGSLGEGFIECHHKNPISNGERITNIADLAMLCSNCHRMIHRKNPAGEYYNIQGLRIILNS